MIATTQSGRSSNSKGDPMAFEKTFYCTQCGTRLLQQGGPCSNCQFDLALDEPYGKTSAKGAAGIGWAQPADDSKYSRYQANQRVYIIVFTSGLILAIVAGMILSKQIALDREGFVVISVLSLLFFLSLGAQFAVPSAKAKSGVESSLKNKAASTPTMIMVSPPS